MAVSSFHTDDFKFWMENNMLFYTKLKIGNWNCVISNRNNQISVSQQPSKLGKKWRKRLQK